MSVLETTDPLEGEVEPVPAADMRARRHPVAIAAVWLFELGAAYLVATPLHAWARAVWGSHPAGDAPLFRPGGYALLGWLDTEGAELGIVLRTSALLLFVLSLASNVVTAGLVAVLATRGGRRFSLAVRTGVAAFFPLLATGIVFGAIEGFFFGVGFFLSSELDHRLADGWGDERAFLARLALLSVFVVLTLASGVVGDLARVAIARDIARGTADRPLRDGIVTAMRAGRAKIGRALLAWGWRSALATGLVVLGVMLSDRMGDRGGGALWVLFFGHQSLVLARAALRTSWLANALRLIDDGDLRPAARPASRPEPTAPETKSEETHDG